MWDIMGDSVKDVCMRFCIREHAALRRTALIKVPGVLLLSEYDGAAQELAAARFSDALML